MKERLCSHKHDFGISTEWISAPSDSIGEAIKTTCSQAETSKVSE